MDKIKKMFPHLDDAMIVKVKKRIDEGGYEMPEEEMVEWTEEVVADETEVEELKEESTEEVESTYDKESVEDVKKMFQSLTAEEKVEFLSTIMS